MFRSLGKLNPEQQDYDALRSKLDVWYRQYNGRLVLEQLQPRLDDILANLFGFHLLQVGRIAGQDLLSSSRIRHRIVVDSDLLETRDCGGGSYLYAELDHLPIACGSVDVVVLPHSLELHPHAHQLLREIDRVLMPEGYVVIVGFNPWSLWGLSRLFLRLLGREPWRGRYLSPRRLKDWCALLGMELVHQDCFFYRPPIPYPAIMNRLQFFERLGKRYWPILGGGYILVGRKKVSTLTPIRPSWRMKRSRRYGPVGVAETSAPRRKSSE